MLKNIFIMLSPRTPIQDPGNTYMPNPRKISGKSNFWQSFFGIGISIIFFLIHSWSPLNAGKIDMDKIIITSNRASCKKDPHNPNLLIFQYLDNVRVKMFRGSTITADTLEVAFNAKEVVKTNNVPATNKKNPETETPTLNNFKHIIFKQHVCVHHKNRKLFADTAYVYPSTKKCMLDGNVKIEQTKKTKKDVPVIIQSSRADIDFFTDAISFSGSEKKPVRTVISLEGKQLFKKKNTVPQALVPPVNKEKIVCPK